MGNRVMMAIMGTSQGWMGILWYPLIRLILENNWALVSLEVKSWRWGIRYWSGMEAKLS